MHNTILLAVGTMSYSRSLEIIVAICNSMCEPEGHYDKWNKPIMEEQMLHDSTSMLYLKSQTHRSKDYSSGCWLVFIWHKL